MNESQFNNPTKEQYLLSDNERLGLGNTKRKKERKPRRLKDFLNCSWGEIRVHVETEELAACVISENGIVLNAKEARRLSAWLLKAAEYLDYQKKEINK